VVQQVFQQDLQVEILLLSNLEIPGGFSRYSPRFLDLTAAVKPGVAISEMENLVWSSRVSYVIFSKSSIFLDHFRKSTLI